MINIERSCLLIYLFCLIFPEDVGNPKVDDFFLNDADYKYTMFVLNLLDFGLMILALAISVILWKWWGNGKNFYHH